MLDIKGTQLPKMKKVDFFTCPCHKIYSVQAVGPYFSNNTFETTILRVCEILANFRDKEMIFCQ